MRFSVVLFVERTYGRDRGRLEVGGVRERKKETIFVIIMQSIVPKLKKLRPKKRQKKRTERKRSSRGKKAQKLLPKEKSSEAAEMREQKKSERSFLKTKIRRAKLEFVSSFFWLLARQSKREMRNVHLFENSCLIFFPASVPTFNRHQFLVVCFFSRSFCPQ